MRNAVRPPTYLSVLCVAAVVCSCSSVNEAEVSGSYAAEYEGGTDTLEIKPDRTYEHVIDATGRRTIDYGTWTIDTWARESTGISLEHFRFRNHDGTIKAPGIWHVEVERALLSGNYRLCFDPDLYKCFAKRS
jgi:hypothetical protein